jgi:hypothetical protein
VSLFRGADRTLIAGDAVVTVKRSRPRRVHGLRLGEHGTGRFLRLGDQRAAVVVAGAAAAALVIAARRFARSGRQRRMRSHAEADYVSY